MLQKQPLWIGENVFTTFAMNNGNHRYQSGLHFRNSQDQWQKLSYDELEYRIRNFSEGLRQLGISEGDRVAILAANRPEWLIADLAILKLGAIAVPIYETTAPREAQFILEETRSKCLIADNLQRILPIAEMLPNNMPVILMSNEQDDHPVFPIYTFKEIEQNGASPSILGWKSSFNIHRNSVATIIYTSGTTGDPKGVVLTHANIIANCAALDKLYAVGPEDRYISFLPPAHIFARVAGGLFMALKGAQIYYSDVKQLKDNIAAVKPTLVVSTPILFEKIHRSIFSAAKKESRLKQTLFRWAVNTPPKRNYYRNRLSRLSAVIQTALADRAVYHKIRSKLGGCVRLMISGGAPLNAEVEDFFNKIGLPIRQGYGLTETTGAAAANSVTLYRRHSVGKAIPGTQIAIKSERDLLFCGGSPTGEILIKGPSVMQGYYQRPEETAKALNRDGWFRTGDLGYLNTAGYLFITGRIKDIIVLSTGKKVSPEPIEQKLKLLCPDIEQICLVGDNKTKISALVFFTEYTTTALEKFEKAVEMVNCELEEFKRIQNYKIIGEPFSLEQDELTPTMKLKRQKIQEHYRETITDLYND